jgi:5,10-methylenetetrahydromethanopterin reductase
MKAGVLLLPHEPVARLAETARLAEASGYEHFWLADERFHREVYASLAVSASLTSRISLGPCVTDPYSRHAALTAMAVATLDEISEGRAVLGIGAGISGFAELGIVREKPAVAIREAVTLVRRLLAGETVEQVGEIVGFRGGRLDFTPPRASVPIYVASNGPLGQRAAGMVADGAIMEACGNPDEAEALRAAVAEGARLAGRDPVRVELVARLNACIGDDGTAARDVLRLRVARTLGAGRLKFATLAAQGLALPDEAKATVAGVPYAAGAEPYRPLLPFIDDRVVDALTLAGTVDEIVARVVALERAGIGQVMIYPFPPPGGTAEDTIRRFGEDVMPRVRASLNLDDTHGVLRWR